MTVDDDQTARDLDALTAEPDGLDGHTIDELADYLDHDRSPVDESIERSAACRHALAALERLRRVAPDLLADPGPADETDDAWLRTLLSRISLDAHDGADFVVDGSADGDETVMTEGALRALVRSAGDDQAGLLVGRVRFTGDLDGDGDPVVLAVEVVVVHGVPIPAAVAALRRAVIARLRRHTRIRDPRIDVVVRDLLGGAA